MSALGTTAKTVLVLEAEKAPAYALLKAIAKSGYLPIAASHLRYNVSSVSRWAGGRRSCPDIERDHDAFAAWLLDEVRRTPYLTVMAFSDKSTQLIAERRDELARHTAIYQPDLATVERVLDKRETHALARELGLLVPEVWELGSGEDLDAFARRLRYPVVLKPVRKIEWVDGRAVFHKVRPENYVWSPVELRSKYERLRRVTTEFEVQRYVEGVGQGYFALIWDGELCAEFAHQRIREYPRTGGASSLRESIECARLRELSVPLLGALGWRGPVMVEYKYSMAEDAHYLMEVNGRWWGSLALAINAGVDFPSLLLARLEGGRTSHGGGYPLGYTSRLLYPHDVMWLLSTLRSLEWRRAAGFFRRADSSDVWDPRDPWPFVADLFAQARVNLLGRR